MIHYSLGFYASFLFSPKIYVYIVEKKGWYWRKTNSRLVVVLANCDAPSPSRVTRVNFSSDRFAEHSEFTRCATTDELVVVPLGAMPNRFLICSCRFIHVEVFSLRFVLQQKSPAHEPGFLRLNLSSIRQTARFLGPFGTLSLAVIVSLYGIGANKSLTRQVAWLNGDVTPLGFRGCRPGAGGSSLCTLRRVGDSACRRAPRVRRCRWA